MNSRHVVDHLIVELARNHGGVVPHGVLLQSHIDTQTITRRQRSGLLVPVLRGASVLGPVDSVSAVQRAIAAGLVVPSAVVSHRSAALLLGAPLLPHHHEAEISLVGDRRRRLAQVTCHRTEIGFAVGDTRWMFGVRISSAVRNAIELASLLPEDELELVLDHYLHLRFATVPRVRAALTRWPNGGRGVPALVQLLDDRENGAGIVRSWLEQQGLRVVRAAGLPEPVRNLVVRVGRSKRVLDLAWPSLHVGVEAHSWRHHSSPGDWGRTLTRDRSLMAIGWHIVPCVVADTRAPDDFVAVLRDTMALAAKRAVDCPREMPGL